MNRPIKFRAWNSTEKKMYFPEYAGHIRWLEDTKDIFIMQFTGLLDKNGEEIYEGDIMRHVPDGNLPHYPFVVFWSDILSAFMVGDEPRKWTEYLSERKHNYIVIGNIYENPELLK